MRQFVVVAAVAVDVLFVTTSLVGSCVLNAIVTVTHISPIITMSTFRCTF